MAKVIGLYLSETRVQSLESFELTVELEGGEGTAVVSVPNNVNIEFNNGSKQIKIQSNESGFRRIKKIVGLTGDTGVFLISASSLESPNVILEKSITRV